MLNELRAIAERLNENHGAVSNADIEQFLEIVEGLENVNHLMSELTRIVDVDLPADRVVVQRKEVLLKQKTL